MNTKRERLLAVGGLDALVRTQAREHYEMPGRLEIDPDAEVNYVPDPPGAWVQAWVWVDDEEEDE